MILEAQGITVRVGAKTLVDGVSLAVAGGETVAIIGPNGAGKSTLLRAVSGEIQASAGAVRLGGRDIKSFTPADLALSRAVLSQSVHVAFPFTVLDVVRMGAGDRRGASVRAWAEEALADVDLLDFRDRVITTLSGGEQQRAHFARVLVQLRCGEAARGPGLLLLDEPTASLDLRHQLDMVTTAKRCAGRGVAVVAILHDLNLATVFADRIVAMHRGRVVADGSPRRVVTDELLETAFGVARAADGVADGGSPFLSPHSLRSLRPG